MAKCLCPITIGKKDGFRRWQVVPCGKCIACRRRRQAGWSFRLLHEMQSSTSSAFLTLTYSDDELVYGEEHPTLVKRHLQLFWKRLRKEQAKVTEDKIKYYACGEYGSRTYRPHYHAIVFNLHPSLMLDDILCPIWSHGFARVDDCNIKSIQYVTKYVMKSVPIDLNGKEREFSTMSKGLGKQFLTPQMVKYYQNHEIPYIVWKDGQKLTMPRYYKEKIYDEETLRRFGREALAEIDHSDANLTSTKVFQIEQEQFKLKKLADEKRSKV